MRLFLAAVVLLILIGAAWRMTGHQLPIVDYPVGPMGAPLIGPKIEIHPPGYDVPVP